MPQRGEVEFKPPFFLRNPVAQSYFGAFWPTGSSLVMQREEIVLNNNRAEQTFEYFVTPPRNPNPHAHWVLILHAWLGDARSPYMKDMANQMWKEGFGVIRIHQRDHGGNQALSTRPFHTAQHEEVSQVIDAIIRRQQIETYSIVGFSIGGQIAFRILSLQQDPKLKSFVSISSYVNLGETLKKIDSSSVVQRLFLYKGLRDQIKKKEKVFPDRYSSRFLKKMPWRCYKIIRKLAVIGYGFSSAEAYFNASDLRKFPLENITVPVLVIASKDDPISDVHNYNQVKWPKKAEFLMPDQGGHIGFIHRKYFPNGSLRWSQFKSVEFVKKYGAIVRA